MNINKLDCQQRVNCVKIDKLFKQLEVVPLFGDMQIAPFNYLKKSPNFDPSKWPISMSNAVSLQSNLMDHLYEMREDHDQYIAELS